MIEFVTILRRDSEHDGFVDGTAGARWRVEASADDSFDDVRCAVTLPSRVSSVDSLAEVLFPLRASGGFTTCRTTGGAIGCLKLGGGTVRVALGRIEYDNNIASARVLQDGLLSLARHNSVAIFEADHRRVRLQLGKASMEPIKRVVKIGRIVNADSVEAGGVNAHCAAARSGKAHLEESVGDMSANTLAEKEIEIDRRLRTLDSPFPVAGHGHVRARGDGTRSIANRATKGVEDGVATR